MMYALMLTLTFGLTSPGAVTIAWMLRCVTGST